MKQKLYALPGTKIKPVKRRISWLSKVKVKPVKKIGTQERLRKGIITAAIL